MSQSQDKRCISLKSTGDLSSSQYLLVQADTNNDDSVVIGTLDCVVIGSVENKPAALTAASVAYAGIVKVVLGDTVTRGGLVVSNASGQAIPKASNHNVFGLALQSGVVNQVIDVLVMRFYD